MLLFAGIYKNPRNAVKNSAHSGREGCLCQLSSLLRCTNWRQGHGRWSYSLAALWWSGNRNIVSLCWSRRAFQKARSHTIVLMAARDRSRIPAFRAPLVQEGDSPRLSQPLRPSVCMPSVEHERPHGGAANRRKNDETDFKPRTAPTERKRIIGAVPRGVRKAGSHEVWIARAAKCPRLAGKHQPGTGHTHDRMPAVKRRAGGL